MRHSTFTPVELVRLALAAAIGVGLAFVANRSLNGMYLSMILGAVLLLLCELLMQSNRRLCRSVTELLAELRRMGWGR